MKIDKQVFINDYQEFTLKELSIKYKKAIRTLERWAKLAGLNGRKKGSGRKKINPFEV